MNTIHWIVVSWMEYHSESESPTYYTPQSKFYALKTLGHMSSDEKWFKKK